MRKKRTRLGYGTEFITASVARGMSFSRHELIRSVGKNGVPGAVIAFAVDSFDSIVDYAQGEIDGKELVYDLGENAVGVAGSMAGAAVTGAVVGSVVPGVGTVIGAGAGLVGGMVGYAVATEAYKMVVEICSEGAEELAEKAQEIATNTVEVAKDIGTDVADTVKNAINDFSIKNDLPFNVKKN